MPLAAVVESLDGLPEAVRAFYVESEGKFILDAEVEEHPRARNLKTALDKERKTRMTLEKAQERFKGIDVDRWEKIKDVDEEELEAFQQWKTKGTKDEDFDGQFQKKLAPMKKDWETRESNYKTKLEEQESRIAKLTYDLHSTKIENEAAKVASELGVRPEAVDDVQLHVKRAFSVNENGEIVALDAEGDVVTGKDGKPLTLKDWLAGKAATKAHWFLSSNGGGAGGGSKNAPTNKKRSEMTVKEKSDFIAKYGEEKYSALPL